MTTIEPEAPSVESWAATSSGAPPQRLAPHVESVAFAPEASTADLELPTVRPSHSASLTRAAKVRRVVLLSDSAVLAAFFGGGLAFELKVLSACALVALVFVVGRVMTLNRVQPMLAMRPIAKTWALALGAACAVVALSGSADTGREVVFGGLAILAALLLIRAALRTRRVQGWLGFAGGHRCLLVGDEETLLPMIAARDAWPGCEEVVGHLLQEKPPSQAPDHEQDLYVERVIDAAHSHRADQVTVVSGGALGAETLRELSWALEDTGIDLAVTTDLQGVATHRVEVTQVGDRLLLRVGSTRPRLWITTVKGALDLSAATVLMLLLGPAILGLLLAIRLDSPGAAIFRQPRVGKGGAEFTMYKFRTMHENAEALMPTLRALNDHGESGLHFKMRNDPRVTRIGRMLRRTSLDELPQLLNVLKGEMSLIGPRPALPSEVARYNKQAMRRLVVKPGMTGLWQVSGRSRLTWQESIRCDLDYVDNWSPARETTIALRTVRAVLTDDGAY